MSKKRVAVFGSVAAIILGLGLMPHSVCGCSVTAPMLFAHVMKSDPMTEDLVILQDKTELWVPVGSPVAYVDEFLGAVSQRPMNMESCPLQDSTRVCRLRMRSNLFLDSGVEVRFQLDSGDRVTAVQVNRY